MKTNLFKTMLCALALLPVGAWAQTTALSEATTIVFDATTAGTYQGANASTGAETSFTNYALDYYGTNRTITSVEGSKSGTIGGQDYSATKYISMNNTTAWTIGTFNKRTAGGNNMGNTTFAPVVAFNTAVPGKVYVSVERRGSGNGSIMLAYQTEADEANKYKLVALETKNFADDAEVKEYEYYIPKATTVLIRGNMNLYAVRFVPVAATTVWKFDQYVKDGEAIFYEAGVGAVAGEYLDGLYFHSRDKKTDSHGVKSKKTKVTNADLETHFGTYLKNTDYMAALLGSGGGTAPGNVEAGECKTIDGISYKAPAAGKFYATVGRSENTTVYVYKNGTEAANVTFSDETPAKEFEIDVVANDNIYLFVATSSGKNVYLWNAGFIPTTAETKEKSVTITSAGYATFSSTNNFDLPSGLKAYIVSDVSDTEATMQEVTEIPACTGVILKGDAGEYTLTSKETTTVDVSSNKLKANIADYALPADDGNGNYNYTLAAGPTFKHSSGSGTTLAAGKAFLRTTVNATSTPAPVLNIAFGGSATGIEKVAVGEQADGVYYNLAGQRVAQPKKGLYIVNGKKVIIK